MWSNDSIWFKILGSSRVWAAFLAIVFVLLGAFLPAFSNQIDQVAVTSAVIALALFIVAESVAGASVGWALLTKPRFWALVISLTFIFVKAFVPGFVLTEDLIQEFIAALGAASIGVSYRPIGTSKVP